MGMFDELICRIELPNQLPHFITEGHRFQTKDLACAGDLYEITADGRFKQVGSTWGTCEPDFITLEQPLHFYTSNWCATAYGFSFTPDGSELETVGYRASFTDGVLTALVEIEHTKEQALARRLLDECDAVVSDSEPTVTLCEPQIGDIMFLQYGGSIAGFPVTLMIKTPCKWAATTDTGDIEVLHPSDFGRLLFHSKEDSVACNEARQNVNERRQQWLADKAANG